MVQRFVWLDALRGIAAITVLIFHYHHFYLADFSSREFIPKQELFPYSEFLFFIYSYGKYAVQLFWVISGFVFFHIYLNKTTTFRKFFVHRFARLYPLHFVTLLLVGLLQFVNLQHNGHWQIYGNNDLYHFVLQLFFASNSLTVAHGLSFNGPIWSVSLEIFTYCVFFLCIPLLKKNCFISTLALFITFVLLGFYFNHNIWKLSQSVFVCASYFFVGGITYLIYRVSINNLNRLAVVVSLTVVGIILSFLYELTNIKLMLISSLMVITVSFLDVKFPVKIKFLESLGNSSYSLYLVHVPIQILILTIADAFFNGNRSFADSWLTLPLFALVSLVVAHYVYLFYEKPVGKWLRKKLL
jgi:peptidoglycan/LPS O-acetylase OafA/YrhL